MCRLRHVWAPQYLRRTVRTLGYTSQQPWDGGLLRKGLCGAHAGNAARLYLMKLQTSLPRQGAAVWGCSMDTAPRTGPLSTRPSLPSSLTPGTRSIATPHPRVFLFLPVFRNIK